MASLRDTGIRNAIAAIFLERALGRRASDGFEVSKNFWELGSRVIRKSPIRCC